MRTIESYDEKTQRTLRPLCKRLIMVETLLCFTTGKEITDADSVYYGRCGLVSDEASYSDRLVYLGTLRELKEWCQCSNERPSQASGAIGHFVSKDELKILERKFKIQKRDRKKVSKKLR
jgi:hypothetical protein